MLVRRFIAAHEGAQTGALDLRTAALSFREKPLPFRSLSLSSPIHALGTRMRLRCAHVRRHRALVRGGESFHQSRIHNATLTRATGDDRGRRLHATSDKERPRAVATSRRAVTAAQLLREPHQAGRRFCPTPRLPSRLTDGDAICRARRRAPSSAPPAPHRRMCPTCSRVRVSPWPLSRPSSPRSARAPMRGLSRRPGSSRTRVRASGSSPIPRRPARSPCFTQRGEGRRRSPRARCRPSRRRGCSSRPVRRRGPAPSPG